MSIIVPPIKCQGIKTKLVKWILSKMPKEFDGIWYEPFMGSGVVGFNVKPKRAVFSDTNPHIIQFYNDMKNSIITDLIVRSYLEEQNLLLKEGGVEYYRFIRERFNSSPNSLDFLFLNRSCFNGIIRFNKKGGFNVPFCQKNNRFSKAYITKIVNQIKAVSKIIIENDYEFRCSPFENIITGCTNSDIIYCDPPYIDRYSDYYNEWKVDDENLLAEELSKTKAKFILSTWHHNKYRANDHIKNYNSFYIDTIEHFYHIGAKERNRNSMVECLITNFSLNDGEEIRVIAI